MRYEPDFRGMSKFLMGSDARRVCTLAAAARLARARALVGKDSGNTAASGRLVHGVGGRRHDRVMVSVVFGGAAVQQQWGRGANRFLTRAFEGD
jgi:hypothetical protein